MTTNWLVIDGTGASQTVPLPDDESPFPWTPGIATGVPAVGMPSRLFQAPNVREIRLESMPVTGSFTWRVTRIDPTGPGATPIDVKTFDGKALESRDENYAMITTPMNPAVLDGPRRVLLMIRWDRLRNIQPV